MREAERVGDRAAFEGFLARYPEGALADRARNTLALMELVPKHVQFGEVELAEGERARFTLETSVENIGDVEITGARLAVAFLDDAGAILGRKMQWVVADREAVADAPEDAYDVLKAGKSRAVHMEFPKSQTPDAWTADAAHVRLDLSELELAEK